MPGFRSMTAGFDPTFDILAMRPEGVAHLLERRKAIFGARRLLPVLVEQRYDIGHPGDTPFGVRQCPLRLFEFLLIGVHANPVVESSSARAEPSQRISNNA